MSMDSEIEEKTTRTAEIELETHQIATKTTTPLHTTDWYIKWVSSVILMVGMISRCKQSVSLEHCCSVYRYCRMVDCFNYVE